MKLDFISLFLWLETVILFSLLAWKIKRNIIRGLSVFGILLTTIFLLPLSVRIEFFDTNLGKNSYIQTSVSAITYALFLGGSVGLVYFAFHFPRNNKISTVLQNAMLLFLASVLFFPAIIFCKNFDSGTCKAINEFFEFVFQFLSY